MGHKGFSTDSYLKINDGVLYALDDLLTAAVLSTLRGLRDTLLKSNLLSEDGSFYMQRERIAKRICVKKPDTIAKHCKKLSELGLLTMEYKGMPRRAFFNLNDDVYEQFNRKGVEQLRGIDSGLEKSQQDIIETNSQGTTSNPPNGLQRPTKRATSNPPNGHITNLNNNPKEESVLSVHKGGAEPHPKKRPQKVGRCVGLEDLGKAKAVRVAEPAHVTIPKSLEPVVAKWREIGVAHADGTKTLRLGVRAAREVCSGKFFLDKIGYAAKARQYTAEQILRAMGVFDTMRNDPDYQPTNKTFLKRITLADFFYSPFVVNGNGPGGGSLFLQCLRTPAKPVQASNPGMTEFVCRMVRKHSGTDPEPEGAARVANKMMRYWQRRERWLKERGVATPKRLVVTWTEMLNERYGGRWDLGNLLGRGMEEAYETHLGGVQ